MFGLRLPRFRFARARNSLAEPDLLSLLAAIDDNDTDEKDTTLRDVHQIADMTQVRALHLVRRMEDEGLLTVEQLSHDRLASRVDLTDLGHRMLEKSRAV